VNKKTGISHVNGYGFVRRDLCMWASPQNECARLPKALLTARRISASL